MSLNSVSVSIGQWGVPKEIIDNADNLNVPMLLLFCLVSNIFKMIQNQRLHQSYLFNRTEIYSGKWSVDITIFY